MSLFDDFFDFIGDTAQDVGDVLENTWDSIKHNPIGAITSVVAMSYGIPPAWAGALGGAAGAAATGGDVIKGAFTGGAMGYMGAQAGAATGALGPIAQAAATGAAASATGAILTGQDVMTAVKAGLILGTVSGGVAQLMTKQEAISSVPKDVLQRAAISNDPIGTLTSEMGWADSVSAQDAANTAWGQNRATSITGLADSIPETVLKEAQALPGYTDKNAFIADKMGWDINGNTTNAIETAYSDYSANNPVTHSFKPVDYSTPTTTATPVSAVASITNTGLVDATSASVLADAGYTANDVQSLIKAGYAATDLADMAATGVPASTLNALANTQFTEAQINDLLTNHVSANNIADASNLVNAGKITVSAADSLMKNGVNTVDLKAIANSGKSDAFAKLMDNGVSRANAQYMLDRGIDLNKAASAIDSGKLTGQQLEASVNNGTYNKVITDATTVAPVQPTGTTTTTTGAVAPTTVDSFIQQSAWEPGSDITASADQVGTQYEQQLATEREANMTASQRTTMESRLGTLGGNVQTWEQAAAGNDYNTFLKKMGWSADNAYTREAYQRGLDSYTGQQQAQTEFQTQQDAYTKAQQPVQPETTIPVKMPDGTVASYNPQTGEVVGPNGITTQLTEAQPQVPDTQVAGNDFTVEVGGVPKFNGMQGAGTPPAGFDVATPEQIWGPNDTGTANKPYTPGAYYDAESNTWYAPKVEEPIVPITPPVTEIPEVTVTAPKIPSIETPNVPIIVPPTTAAPTTNVVQPTAPVAPQTPTVVDKQTTDNGDGTSTVVTFYNNGSSTSNIVANTTTVQPPATEIPEITVTAPKEPPLTPPVTTVIPETPKIPEVVAETPTEPVTPTEPTVPEEPTVPIVPIIPPTGPSTPPTLHGVSNIGPIPNLYAPKGLNPGWITNVPAHYVTTNPAQAQYYWGAHPYQPGSTFDPNLYNQTPNAPAEAWGAKQAQTAATADQILAAMKGQYPLLNTVSVNGPVAP
jgi:hypothetical protein